MRPSPILPLAFAALSTSAPTKSIERRADQCGDWDSVATGSYTLYQNLWGYASATSGGQCSGVDSLDGDTLAWYTTWSWSGASSSVKSFANAYLTMDPVLVSGLTSISTTWDWSYTGTDLVADVAYDLFLNSDASASTHEYEIMVWLSAMGGAGPISSTGSAVATPTIGGSSWNLYDGYNGDMHVFSFIASDATDLKSGSFSGDLVDFITYLTENEGLETTQYLQSIQAGTEPFTGSDATMTTTAYSCVLNGSNSTSADTFISSSIAVAAVSTPATSIEATSATFALAGASSSAVVVPVESIETVISSAAATLATSPPAAESTPAFSASRAEFSQIDTQPSFASSATSSGHAEPTGAMPSDMPSGFPAHSGSMPSGFAHPSGSAMPSGMMPPPGNHTHGQGPHGPHNGTDFGLGGPHNGTEGGQFQGPPPQNGTKHGHGEGKGHGQGQSETALPSGTAVAVAAESGKPSFASGTAPTGEPTGSMPTFASGAAPSGAVPSGMMPPPRNGTDGFGEHGHDHGPQNGTEGGQFQGPPPRNGTEGEGQGHGEGQGSIPSFAFSAAPSDEPTGTMQSFASSPEPSATGAISKRAVTSAAGTEPTAQPSFGSGAAPSGMPSKPTGSMPSIPSGTGAEPTGAMSSGMMPPQNGTEGGPGGIQGPPPQNGTEGGFGGPGGQSGTEASEGPQSGSEMPTAIPSGEPTAMPSGAEPSITGLAARSGAPSMTGAAPSGMPTGQAGSIPSFASGAQPSMTGAAPQASGSGDPQQGGGGQEGDFGDQSGNSTESGSGGISGQQGGQQGGQGGFGGQQGGQGSIPSGASGIAADMPTTMPSGFLTQVSGAAQPTGGMQHSFPPHRASGSAAGGEMPTGGAEMTGAPTGGFGGASAAGPMATASA